MFQFILNRMLSKEAALEYMRHFFANAPAGDRSDLWNILTGLRGPDNQDRNSDYCEEIRQLKRATTAVIRYEFLGEVGAEKAGSYAITREDEYDFYFTRASITDDDCGEWGPEIVPAHFLKHAKRAFKGLGLQWNNINHRG